MSELKRIEPDWKRAFYSVAMRVYAATVYLELGKADRAEEFLNKATDLISAIDGTPQFIDVDSYEAKIQP